MLKKIMIFGASRGLGLAFVKTYLEKSNAEIIAIYRNESSASALLDIQSERLTKVKIDPFNEDELKELSITYKNIDLMINTIGHLHNGNYSPEKSLRDINTDQLLYSFKVNTILTPLLLKHFKNNFTDIGTYLVLGAKVGSIADNEMGGWYAYRASKCALNMMVKNIDIELKRSKKNIRMLVFHPGTTETELSAPFIKGIKHKIWKPVDASDNLSELIEKVYPKDDLFYFWDGSVLPW